LFGLPLARNFARPYFARNFTEFWQRWHISLSEWLRDYIFFPSTRALMKLVPNRQHLVNLVTPPMVTMLVSGLWHGVSWHMIVWGGLHGLYLVINHAWHRARQMLGWSNATSSRIGKLMAWLITFVAVVVGWVFFRATDFHSAVAILKGMFGINGVALPNAILARIGGVGDWLQDLGVRAYLSGGSDFLFTYLWVISLLLAVLLMPNTQQIMSRFEPALRIYRSDSKYEIRLGERLTSRLLWQPSAGWSLMIGVVAALGILALTSISEFLYFQF
jgi:hypothetical protein